MEIWKIINDYPYYEVSNYGRVRSKDKYVKCGNGYAWKKGKIIKAHPNRDGYLMLRIRNNPLDKKNIAVHILVANAFVTNRENKSEVNHKDGLKSNNHYSNLEWATRSDNLVHALRLGLRKVKNGENSNLSKLNEEKVLEIRRLYNEKKYSYADLGQLFDITGAGISAIIKRKTWNHI